MTPPHCSPFVVVLALLIACGKLHRQDVGNFTPSDEETTHAGHDASPRAPNDTAGSGNSPAGNSNTTTTSPSVQPPAAESCPDTPCPSGQCCVDGTQCGNRMHVQDFHAPCLLRGDADGTLDDSCPAHACIDPRARCTFSGCRTTTGECGVWVDRYSYRTGDQGTTYTVNLGCIVLPKEQ